MENLGYILFRTYSDYFWSQVWILPLFGLLAPWVLPGCMSQLGFMRKSTYWLTGVLRNPSGCSRYETAPFSILPQPCPVNHQRSTSALSSTGRGVGVDVCHGWQGRVHHPLLEQLSLTHKLLWQSSFISYCTSDPGHTRAYSHLTGEDAIRSSEEFMEGTCTQAHAHTVSHPPWALV